MVALYRLALLAGLLGLNAMAVEEVRTPDTCPATGFAAVPPRSLAAFVDSLGVGIHVSQGYDPASYIGPLRYLGLRNVRDGSLRPDTLRNLARKAGVKVVLVANDEPVAVVKVARGLREADVLRAIEGPNEPNGFPLRYQGRLGGRDHGWRPVAEYQRDLYRLVRAEPQLIGVPVLSPSEVGGQTENMGLQFLAIPAGANTLMPAGTVYANMVAVHNYVAAVHGGYGDNQAWNAADPVLQGRWDSLAKNHGVTWRGHFAGYNNAQLEALPRATTETGWESSLEPEAQQRQAAVLTNTLLAQFARGWRLTLIYQLRDNEGGRGLHGLYAGMQPKLAAEYIHTLTTLLADRASTDETPAPTVTVAHARATTHALLLVGTGSPSRLFVWGENAVGESAVMVRFSSHQSGTVHDLARGTRAVARFSGRDSLCLRLTDHALVITL